MILNIKITEDYTILQKTISELTGRMISGLNSRSYGLYINNEWKNTAAEWYIVICEDEFEWKRWMEECNDTDQKVLLDTELSKFLEEHRGEIVMNKLNLV